MAKCIQEVVSGSALGWLALLPGHRAHCAASRTSLPLCVCVFRLAESLWKIVTSCLERIKRELDFICLPEV